MLIHCARTIIDRAMKAQGGIAVENELANLRNVMETLKACQPQPPAPVGLRPIEPKPMTTEQEMAEACRQRMLWMTNLGDTPSPIRCAGTGRKAWLRSRGYWT